nr:28S ribosomal protein S29, mitochondrial-like [Ciona intestinalis]|eukprot:XP_009859583.1 28S ribosomal protein S29, mitochondrial-like [Ciona intestinalis]
MLPYTCCTRYIRHQATTKLIKNISCAVLQGTNIPEVIQVRKQSKINLRTNSDSSPGLASSIKKIYCNERDPGNHTLKDIGLMHEIPKEDQSSLVLKYDKGFRKKFLTEASAVDKLCIMIRKPGLELVNYLKHANYSTAVNRYLMYGPAGCGKTMTMMYAVDYCKKQGWLIVPVFNPWTWIQYKNTYIVHQREEIVRSLWNKDRVDHPEIAARWLENFRQINSDLLENVFTTREYTWSKHEKTKSGVSFSTLVDLGIARVRIATDVAGCILREIINQDSPDFPRTLAAVDCANSFFGISTLKIEPGVYLEPNELALVHNFKKILSNKWKNGAVIVGLNTSGIPSQTKRIAKVSSEHPYDILGQEGFDILDPHIPIHVPHYTDKEAISHLAYYQDRKWLVGRSTTEAGEAEILQICGNSPTDICVYCGHLY